MEHRSAKAVAVFSIVCGFVLGLMPQDWIEVWLGLDPDSNTGFTEIAFMFIPITFGVGLLIFDTFLSTRINEKSHMT
jgi:hypothetical protein